MEYGIEFAFLCVYVCVVMFALSFLALKKGKFWLGQVSFLGGLFSVEKSETSCGMSSSYYLQYLLVSTI